MKRETKLIPNVYDIIRDIDVRLSTSNAYILSALTVDAKKGKKLKKKEKENLSLNSEAQRGAPVPYTGGRFTRGRTG